MKDYLFSFQMMHKSQFWKMYTYVLQGHVMVYTFCTFFKDSAVFIALNNRALVIFISVLSWGLREAESVYPP